MGKNGIKTDRNGIEVEKNKKIGGKNKKSGVGWVEKNKKNLLGGSLSCALAGKGEGVYAARRPFANVTNVTHANETIYYIHTEAVPLVLYIIYSV